VSVTRTVFATPRAAEFLEVDALQRQTGQPQSAFGRVVLKELIDNESWRKAAERLIDDDIDSIAGLPAQIRVLLTQQITRP
jgi:hypothetical protein